MVAHPGSRHIPELSVTSPANKNACSKEPVTLLRGLKYRSKESEAKGFQRGGGTKSNPPGKPVKHTEEFKIQGGSNSWQNSAM